MNVLWLGLLGFGGAWALGRLLHKETPMPNRILTVSIRERQDNPMYRDVRIGGYNVGHTSTWRLRPDDPPIMLRLKKLIDTQRLDLTGVLDPEYVREKDNRFGFDSFEDVQSFLENNKEAIVAGGFTSQIRPLPLPEGMRGWLTQHGVRVGAGYMHSAKGFEVFHLGRIVGHVRLVSRERAIEMGVSPGVQVRRAQSDHWTPCVFAEEVADREMAEEALKGCILGLLE